MTSTEPIEVDQYRAKLNAQRGMLPHLRQRAANGKPEALAECEAEILRILCEMSDRGHI